jgi:hypothetical protein
LRARIHALVATAVVASAITACHAAPQPKSAAPLRGRAFLLQSSEGADLLAGTTVHLRFSDGSFSVSGSCTRASQRDCTDNDKEAADFVRSVLVDGELTYEIDARMLTLKSSGSRSLGARAAEPSPTPAP